MNFLICHLVQEQGQKKSLDKIKASLKQAIQVPSNFVSSSSLLWHQASSLMMKLSAATASNIFYTLSDKTRRASAIRLRLTNSLPQDSFLQSTGWSKCGFQCVSKQQY
jgi:hypothetical protein